MRISDWSSDVCSSDLDPERGHASEVQTMSVLDEVNFEGTFWKDIDWRKPIHQMEFCNCCGIPADDYIMGGHISACYYLTKNMDTPAARAFLEGQIREALERSEEHTSELQSLMRISDAIF